MAETFDPWSVVFGALIGAIAGAFPSAILFYLEVVELETRGSGRQGWRRSTPLSGVSERWSTTLSAG